MLTIPKRYNLVIGKNEKSKIYELTVISSVLLYYIIDKYKIQNYLRFLQFSMMAEVVDIGANNVRRLTPYEFWEKIGRPKKIGFKLL